MTAKKISQIAMLSAVAIVLGYIESCFPPIVPIAGVKVGLSNIAVMCALYKLDAKSAGFVAFVKVLVTALWFSGLNSLIFSALGAIFALFSMIIFKKLKLSQIGVGVCGGVFHNIGQTVAAAFVMSNAKIGYLVPPLLISGILAGVVVGVVTRLTLKMIKNI